MDFTADTLSKLFDDMSQLLHEQGMHCELFVVGGAAMALAYDSNRATQDVDAVFSDASVVREIAHLVAAKHSLPADWLNDAAKGFMPGTDEKANMVYQTPFLTVHVASAQYLLAMKLFSGRPGRDYHDAAILFNKLGLTNGEQAGQILEEYYPQNLLLPRHNYIPDEVARIAHQLRHREQPRTADDIRHRLEEKLSSRQPPSHGESDTPRPRWSL